MNPLGSRSGRARLRLAIALALFTATVSLACAPSPDLSAPEPVPYAPDRRDYVRFRARHPVVLDPNYLPFMVHRVPVTDPPGDLLFFCRWPDGDLPLPVAIAAPLIPESLQNEFWPVEPETYVASVERALGRWERELEGRVLFRRVDDPTAAQLVLRILGEEAPTPEEDVQVLGSTESLLDACHVQGEVGPDTDPVPVTFRVPELLIYVADRAGLLTPDQVERVALHEIGHALGMRGHSPIPTDFMYPVVRDRPGVNGLSTEDSQSFMSLYAIPNGSRYAFAPAAGPGARPEPVPPSVDPVLAIAPHVDARHGYEIRPPEDWLRIATDRGFFAANGPIWDRDASIEVVVWPYPTIRSFLRRFHELLFADTWFLWQAPVVMAGRSALWIAVEDDTRTQQQEFLFIELGDGRVMMILTDSPALYAGAWRTWFRAIVASLEIWNAPGSAR